MPTRRAVILPAALAAVAPGLAFAQAVSPPRLQAGRAPSKELTPTPQCSEGKDAVTPAQTEGPYFKPSSPERSSLVEAGVTGTPLRVGGYVLNRRCRPVERVLIDLWQADDAGEYDDAGYRLRGHQFTDAQGRWQFETIVPGLYAGRTRHIHVKVQAQGEAILTTQLYFPADEQRNLRDSLFNKRLLMTVAANEAGVIGRFDFVLDMA